MCDRTQNSRVVNSGGWDSQSPCCCWLIKTQGCVYSAARQHASVQCSAEGSVLPHQAVHPPTNRDVFQAPSGQKNTRSCFGPGSVSIILPWASGSKTCEVGTQPKIVMRPKPFHQETTKRVRQKQHIRVVILPVAARVSQGHLMDWWQRIESRVRPHCVHVYVPPVQIWHPPAFLHRADICYVKPLDQRQVWLSPPCCLRSFP